MCMAVCGPLLSYKTFFWTLIQFYPCKGPGVGVWQAKDWDLEYVSKTHSVLWPWLWSSVVFQVVWG